MVRRMNGKLAAYNHIAQHYQDEAFTLAYYLTGKEKQAVDAVQDAFARLFQVKGLQPEYFRFDALRLVVENCRKTGGRYPYAVASDDINRQLLLVNGDERCILVLVDILGLGYAEAAQVLGCSVKRVAQLLTQGRVRLARQSKTPARLVGV